MAAMTPDAGAEMTPDDVARKTFTMVRKGFDPIEVQGFLLAVAAELRQTRADLLELDRELRVAQDEVERSRHIDPARLTALLGEETARVLDAAREAADDIKAKAEQSSLQLLEEATAEAARVRKEADDHHERRRAEADADVEAIRTAGEEIRTRSEADAAAEIERGRQQGREMVAEAQKVRERMLNDLARRRKAFRQQIEQLQAGRDRLAAAYDVVRDTLDVATEELRVALPEARLAAEAAALRAGEEDEPTAEDLEREAALLPDVELGPSDESAATETAAAEAEPEPEPEPEAAAEAPTMVVHDDSVEGRHSSSVKVIRAAEPEPEPEPPAPEPAVAAAPELEVESGAAPAPDADGPADEVAPDEAGGQQVSSLFARIREETEASEPSAGPEVDAEPIVHEDLVEEVVLDEAELAELARLSKLATAAAGPAAPEAEAEPAEPGAEASDPDHELLGRRDDALAELERNLGRRVKRELSDEQNELLDTVRRQRGTPTAAAALPALDAHHHRYRTAVLPSLVAASAAGADLVSTSAGDAGGSGEAVTGQLASELAAELVDPLRERLERAFSESADDGGDLAERVRACYREWKSQRVDGLVERFALGAANRGLVDRLPEGTLVHWVVEDGTTPSPDCDDNALAGDIPKGEPFPTGHVAPPISPTCRCLVVPKSA
jgi:DivIVA domain-containing protein